MLASLLAGLPEWALWMCALLAVVGYLTCCLVGWYFIAGFGYALNSGQLGRSRYWFPFECFAENAKCYLPGGKQHRIEFIKIRSGGEGWFMGSRRSYSHEEIRKKENYEEVFYGMMGGHFSFWGGNFTMFFFSPVLIACLICSIPILLLFNAVLWVYDEVKDKWRASRDVSALQKL